MCAGRPAGGAARLRLGRGAGAWGAGAWGGEASREGNLRPCAARAAQESVSRGWTFSPALLALPSFGSSPRPSRPAPFQAGPPAPPTWRPREGIWALVPAGLGLGAGGRRRRDLGLLGEGVFSLPQAGWGGSLGRGLGRGGSEREPCLSLRCRGEQMAGEGRGYVAGGGGVRGPADEEPRISTPRVSQERAPSPSLPRKREGQRLSFAPRRLGLWPATDLTAPSPAPGAPPTPRAPPPPTRRWPGRRGRGLWELPGMCELMGPHSGGEEGRGGGGKRLRVRSVCRGLK